MAIRHGMATPVPGPYGNYTNLYERHWNSQENEVTGKRELSDIILPVPKDMIVPINRYHRIKDELRKLEFEDMYNLARPNAFRIKMLYGQLRAEQERQGIRAPKYNQEPKNAFNFEKIPSPASKEAYFNRAIRLNYERMHLAKRNADRVDAVRLQEEAFNAQGLPIEPNRHKHLKGLARDLRKESFWAKDDVNRIVEEKKALWEMYRDA